METPDKAIKFNQGKPKFSLIPPDALEGLAKLYTMGAVKYGDRNWEKGMDWSEIVDALERHLNHFKQGELYAQDDGQHHMLAVAWCAFTLYCYHQRDLGTNDIPNISGADTVWNIKEVGF